MLGVISYFRSSSSSVTEDVMAVGEVSPKAPPATNIPTPLVREIEDETMVDTAVKATETTVITSPSSLSPLADDGKSGNNHDVIVLGSSSTGGLGTYTMETLED